METKDGAANLYWPVKEPLYIILVELPINDIKMSYRELKSSLDHLYVPRRK